VELHGEVHGDGMGEARQREYRSSTLPQLLDLYGRGGQMSNKFQRLMWEEIRAHEEMKQSKMRSVPPTCGGGKNASSEDD
jgi:hypothetical protein